MSAATRQRGAPIVRASSSTPHRDADYWRERLREARREWAGAVAVAVVVPAVLGACIATLEAPWWVDALLVLSTGLPLPSLVAAHRRIAESRRLLLQDRALLVEACSGCLVAWQLRAALDPAARLDALDAVLEEHDAIMRLRRPEGKG